MLVRDYSDVQRLFCQTSWGRGTSELVPYQKVDICPSKIDALLRRFWFQRTALELYKSGSSGGGSTGLTWWEIFLIVLAVLAVVFIITIVLCCILNTRCKFGDVCQDSPLSFTFPPDNESKVKITPASNLDYKEGTPNKESKVKITPASNLDYKEGTPNKGSNENATPKSKPVDKKVTPNQEAIINYNLNNEKSSVATIPQRTGAFQQLNPLNKGEGRNGNGEDLPK